MGLVLEVPVARLRLGAGSGGGHGVTELES